MNNFIKYSFSQNIKNKKILTNRKKKWIKIFLFCVILLIFLIKYYKLNNFKPINY